VHILVFLRGFSRPRPRPRRRFVSDSRAGRNRRALTDRRIFCARSNRPSGPANTELFNKKPTKKKLNRRPRSSQRLLVDKESSFITFVNFAAFCSNDLSASVYTSLFPPFAPVQDLLRSLRSSLQSLFASFCRLLGRTTRIAPPSLPCALTLGLSLVDDGGDIELSRNRNLHGP
jgi:hypothetical protein